MISRSVISALAAAATLAIATPAAAVPLKFSFTGIYNGTFQIDSNPVTSGASGVSFNAEYTGGTGDFPAAANIIFYDPSSAGGFNLSTAPADFSGPILYSGPTAKPTLLTGTFSLNSGTESLTVGPGAPAPEIAKGLLAALTAFGALALTRRNRLSPRTA